MGIPYYFYQIYKKYHKNDIVSESNIFNVDILFFDYNSMIHPVAHKTMQRLDGSENTGIEEGIEEGIINDCISYTRYIISILKPKTVYIMIDGVAPIAKIKQQRERRYKSFLFKQQTQWDTNNITPGTQFMSKLSLALEKFKHDIDESSLFISDASEPGEGEHKMMKIIESLPQDYTVGIYGLDADLIMLSLLKSETHKIILLRDNSFNDKIGNKTYLYLDVKNLFDCICKEFSQYGIVKQTPIELIRDYIFICFFIGNDFLHSIPSIKIKHYGIQNLIKAYVNVRDNIINSNLTINYRALSLFLFHCFNIEQNTTLNTIKCKDSVENCTVHDYQVFFYKDDIIQSNRKRYYTYYGIHNINDACHNYIEGLNWVLGYYHGHQHNNWTWCYKYQASPFFEDLYNYIKSRYDNMEIIISPSEPLLQLTQLLMVLPKESLYNVLDEKTKLQLKRFNRIYNQNYPQNISVDLIDKEFLWQSTIFFKPFDISLLNICLQYF